MITKLLNLNTKLALSLYRRYVPGSFTRPESTCIKDMPIFFCAQCVVDGGSERGAKGAENRTPQAMSGVENGERVTYGNQFCVRSLLRAALVRLTLSLL